jgi:hypothetical protein
MVGDSTDGFPTAPAVEERTNLPSPMKHDAEAPPASTMTAPQPKNPLTNQAIVTIPPRQETLRSGANLPLE